MYVISGDNSVERTINLLNQLTTGKFNINTQHTPFIEFNDYEGFTEMVDDAFTLKLDVTEHDFIIPENKRLKII